MTRDTLYYHMPEFVKDIWRFIKGRKMFLYSDEKGCLLDTGAIDYLKQCSDDEYYSQYGQDMLITNLIFGRKTQGVFLDIGGNHPILCNNTAYLEKNLNWSGLAFEPQKEVADLWKTSRSTECIPVALGDCEGTIKFYKDGEAGDELFMKSGKMSVGGEKGENKNQKCIEVPQRRLQDILDERDMHEIDFASIDVEGCELDVLKGIDFDKTYIYCMMLENEEQEIKRCKMLRDFMKSKGYILIARGITDDIFVKSSGKKLTTNCA